MEAPAGSHMPRLGHHYCPDQPTASQAAVRTLPPSKFNQISTKYLLIFLFSSLRYYYPLCKVVFCLKNTGLFWGKGGLAISPTGNGWAKPGP